jgi:hypothetical protein
MYKAYETYCSKVALKWLKNAKIPALFIFTLYLGQKDKVLGKVFSRTLTL